MGLALFRSYIVPRQVLILLLLVICHGGKEASEVLPELGYVGHLEAVLNLIELFQEAIKQVILLLALQRVHKAAPEDQFS